MSLTVHGSEKRIENFKRLSSKLLKEQNSNRKENHCREEDGTYLKMWTKSIIYNSSCYGLKQLGEFNEINRCWEGFELSAW